MKTNPKKKMKTATKTTAKKPTASKAATKRPPSEHANFIREKVKAIRALLATEDQNVSLVRYEVGEHVNEARTAEDTHGKGVVEQIAKELGRDVDTLYDYAAVAATFTREGFKQISKRTHAGGLSLTFSHFVELARKPGGKGLLTCEPLLERALNERLSVRALRELVRAELSPEPTPAPSVLRRLMKISKTFAANSAHLGEVAVELEGSEMTLADREELVTAIDQVKGVGEAWAAVLERLRAVAGLPTSSSMSIEALPTFRIGETPGMTPTTRALPEPAADSPPRLLQAGFGSSGGAR